MHKSRNIKEYILEKFDLKVSTLYIAQIKKKCGIVLREHYNKLDLTIQESKKRETGYSTMHTGKRGSYGVSLIKEMLDHA